MKRVKAAVLCLLTGMFFESSACLTFYGMTEANGDQNEVELCITEDHTPDASSATPDIALEEVIVTLIDEDQEDAERTLKTAATAPSVVVGDSHERV